jgi:hypothetical protein
LGLLALSALHVPIGRYLQWREECTRMSAVNSTIFQVHALFICLVLVMMGLPCLLDPRIFIEQSRAGAWFSWSFAVFWAVRLYCQWFVYKAHLWRHKRFETRMHWLFTFLWAGLTALFSVCGLLQLGAI